MSGPGWTDLKDALEMSLFRAIVNGLNIFLQTIGTNLGRKPLAVRPPVENARDLIDYLVEVGILRARSDGRLDAADLFLTGLGLKRKGGVRKK